MPKKCAEQVCSARWLNPSLLVIDICSDTILHKKCNICKERIYFRVGPSFLPWTILFLVPSLLVAGLCAETIYTRLVMTRSRTSSRNPYLYSFPLLVISLCAAILCCRRATTRSRTSTWSGSASARTSSPACSPTQCSRALRWQPHLQVCIIIFILDKYLCVLPIAIINSWQHHLQVYVILNLETLMQTLYFVDKQIIQF